MKPASKPPSKPPSKKAPTLLLLGCGFEQIEALRIARELGYTIVDHRLELYAVPLQGSAKKDE